MSHQVQVIWILCLSTPHHTVSVENDNLTVTFDNHSSLLNNDTLLAPHDVVTTCQPSPPFLVREPPASVTCHEDSLVTIAIVFCDLICNKTNVSWSDMSYEDVNMTCSRQDDGFVGNTSCEDDILFDDISENFNDTSNTTTVKWSLSGLTLFPGTW